MSDLQTRARSAARALEAGRYDVPGVSLLLAALADELDHARSDCAALGESLRLRQIEVDRLLMLVRSQERAL